MSKRKSKYLYPAMVKSYAQLYVHMYMNEMNIKRVKKDSDISEFNE